jgi:hypothetical protein
MPPNNEKEVLKYNIVVSPRGMAEAHGKKAVIFVPASEINRITLKFGRAEHRPIVSISIGAVLALVGLFGLDIFFTGKKGNRYDLGLVALGIIGGSLIFDALKQRYFLDVEKNKDSARLIFSKNAERNGVGDFCKKIKDVYGYSITDETQRPG